jgi:hypothetical protein
MTEDAQTYKTATFGAGCFWGVEEAFSRVNGVVATAVGYMGGSLKNPTYNDVCTGQNSKKIQRGHRDFRYIQVWKNHDCDHAGTGILPGRRIPPALLQKAWRFVWYIIKNCISRISVQFLTVPPVSHRAINLLWPLSEEIP